MRKGYSKVYTSAGVVEEERPFKESYFRVIQIANEYINQGYLLHKIGGTRVVVVKGINRIQIGHSNGENMRGNIYVNNTLPSNS